MQRNNEPSRLMSPKLNLINLNTMKRYIILVFALFAGILTFAQSSSFNTTYRDTLSFEDNSGDLIINQDSTNLWQIGEPQKVLFDSAYTRPNAIMTDTIQFYPANNESTFILKLDTNSFNSDFPDPETETTLEFWHKFDTDTLQDWCTLEVSYNGGTTWDTLSTDTNYCVEHWTEIPGPPSQSMMGPTAYSGSSHGWQKESFRWIWALLARPNGNCGNIFGVSPDSIWLRFKFVSDSVDTQKEGWMIDNITVIGDFISSIDGPIQLSPSISYPNPVSDILYIDAQDQEFVKLTVLDAQGKKVFVQSFDATPFQLSVKHLPNGLYFYLIENTYKDQRSRGQFMVQH